MFLSALGLTASLGVLLPVLTVARGVPQAVRVYKVDAEGVSRSTWLLVIAVAELWTAYGFVFRVPAQIAANVPSALLAGLIVYRVARAERATARSLASAAALTAGAAAVMTASLATHAGWVLSVPAVLGSLFLYLPQLAKVLREEHLVGVSLTTWLLALLTAVGWGAYGLLIHQLPVWVPCTVTIPSSFVIVVRLLRPRLMRHTICQERLRGRTGGALRGATGCESEKKGGGL